MDQERLEYLISAVDQTRQAVESARRNLEQLANESKKVNDQMAQASKAAVAAWQHLGSTLNGVASGIEKALSSLAGVFRTLIGHAVDLAKQIAGALGDAFKRLAAVAGTVAGVVGGALITAFTAIGRAGVDMNVTLEGTQMALTRITGSSSGAAKLIGELRAEARISALTFKEMLPIAQSLAAVYGPQGIGKVVPTMRAFGDTATALRVSSQGLSDSLLAFRQLVGQDHPQERQLKELSMDLPGLNVNAILKRAFGSSDTEALKAAHVTGAQVGEAIVKGMQEAFGGSQQALGHTIPVILSNFQDAFNDLAAAVTSRFTPQLTNALGKLLDTFSKLGENEKFIQALAVPFDLLGKALEYLSGLLPKFADWLTQILTKENVIRLLANIAGWFSAITQEVQRFLSAVSGGKTLGDVFTTFRDAAVTAIDFVLKLWNGLVSAIQYLVDHKEQLGKVFADMFAVAQAGLETLIGGVAVLAGALLAIKLPSWLGPAMGILNMGGAGGGGKMAGIVPGLPDQIPFQNQLPWWAGGSKGAPLASWGEQPRPITPQELAKIPPELRKNYEPKPPGLPFGGQIDFLRGVGRNVMGGIGSAAGAAGQAIPGEVRDLFSGTANAAYQGYQSGGVGALMRRQQEESDRAAAFLRKATTPATAKASNIPPSEILGGQNKGASAPAGPSAEEMKDLMERRTAYYEALQEEMSVAVQGAPAAEKGLLEVQRILPILQGKVRDVILPQLRMVQQGSKAYYDLLKNYWDIQGNMIQIQQRAAEEQAEAAKKALEKQEQTLERTGSALEKLIGLLPEGARGLASKKLLGPQVDRLQGLAAQETDPEKKMDLLGRGLDLSQRILGDQPKDPFGGLFGNPGMDRARGAILNIALSVNAADPDAVMKAFSDILDQNKRLIWGD